MNVVSRDIPEPAIANLEDEGQILGMCRRLWEENGLFSYNEDKVRECLRRCYDRKDKNETPVVVGVIKNMAGTIEACTCLMVSDFYYTDDWHLAELWNFVDRDYRRSRNAEGLITFGMRTAEIMGLPFFTGIITNKRMAGKVGLYRRLLGSPTGAFFVHNGKWKTEPMEDHADLRRRLAEYADLCNNLTAKVDSTMLRKEAAPLLAEAAEALGREDTLWSSHKRNTEGT